jgi:hypothetical protein|tara:strand:+ start:10 stop:225 length:216 start_codon:yes stop_codon:yes gene_type:complete
MNQDADDLVWILAGIVTEAQKNKADNGLHCTATISIRTMNHLDLLLTEYYAAKGLARLQAEIEAREAKERK